MGKLNLSRRSFMKGAVTVSTAAALYGCSKSGEGEIIYAGGTTGDAFYSEDIYNVAEPVYRYGTSAHNCGGRCLMKAQVVDGRIVRFLSDESVAAWDGADVGLDNRNCTQYRACSRCRSYKYRLYHPGRLKYPLKQTIKRGRLDGFRRISWKQALTEMTEKHKAVTENHGFESFLSVYGCGNTSGLYQGSSYGVFANYALFGTNFASAAIKLLGGSVPFANDYSFHQYQFMGAFGTSYAGLSTADSLALFGAPIATANDFAGMGKSIVLWGSNILTTSHHESNSWIQAIEEMKARDASSNVVFIGPEFVDTGVTLADKWVKSRPYTDVAFIMAMMYEMIINTFDEDGNIKPNPWLDVDYIDAMVYGFFDSPEYYLDKATGNISMTPQADYIKVDAVLPGTSLSAYIMGSDNRLTLADYSSGKTYIAKQFTKGASGSGTSLKRNSLTAYISKPTSPYKYKHDLGETKTPEWASRITGVPASEIRSLAKLYTDPAQAPVWTEFIGGQLKQADGCVTFFALQALCILTKNWGKTACGIARNGFVTSNKKDPNDIAVGIFNPATWGSIPLKQAPIPSATQWHNAVRFTFRNELKANGYKPNIPDFTDWETNIYYDDGGTKTLLRWDRDTATGNIKTYTEGGKTYYQWYGKDEGKTPEYAGFRFILNSGGNMPLNQNMNTNEGANMFEHLPFSPESADPDSFYLVTFDNFMSPSARWSDYVLPGKTTWEQEDCIQLKKGNTVYIDNVVEKAPGESLSTWDFAREWLNVQDPSGAKAEKFTGLTKDSTFKDVVKKKFTDEISVSAASPHYGKTWEEFVKKPYTVCAPVTKATVKETLMPARAAIDAYLADPDIGIKPLRDAGIATVDANTVGYGLVGDNHFNNSKECPNQSDRYHVFSGSLVWRYENQFNKWHGWTQTAGAQISTIGQTNDDGDGGKIVYPIPMYFAYEDYFKAAYGLSDFAALTGRYLLTTSHDRYRAHSSHAENPIMRELNHRTSGGGLYSCDDAGDYSIAASKIDPATGEIMAYNPPESLIGNDGSEQQGASYSEIWIAKDNDKDIMEGDLVDIWNEIGAVRCVARTTIRCVPGFIGLHEGCWYDPREIPNKSPHKSIDVGGCCNTLMATRPSRIDKGNAQQSAMVYIEVFRKAAARREA